MSLKQIKDKLSKCFKNHQPVLLYNDTLDKRNDLIMTTYIDNGGNLNDVHNIPVKSFEELLRDYYYDEKRKISGGTLKGFDEGLISFIEDIRSQKRKDSMRNKSREIFKSTEKSYRYHDCKGKYGKKVHHLLVADEIWIKESGIGNLLEMHRRTPELIFGEQGNPFIDYIGSYLLHFEGMLFVDNLECNKGIEDNVWYRRLADVIKENKVSVNWLVVYVHNIGNFQNDFLELFDEQICIEEEKAGVEPVKERIKTEDRQQEGKIVQFQTLPGTKWTDVEITFIDNDYVRIKVGDEVKNRVHYSEMGFKDERSGQPIQLWKDTLRKFALANGVIPPKHDKFGKLIETVSADDVKRLRKKLQSYFCIPGDPISYIKGKYIKGKYIEAEGYKTLFRIKDESHIQDSVYNNQE